MFIHQKVLYETRPIIINNCITIIVRRILDLFSFSLIIN